MAPVINMRYALRGLKVVFDDAPKDKMKALEFPLHPCSKPKLLSHLTYFLINMHASWDYLN